jgi:hypothetical protein
MGKDEDQKTQDWPKTWSADHGGGVVPPSGADDHGKKSQDEGIRPDKLNSENDQGAS